MEPPLFTYEDANCLPTRFMERKCCGKRSVDTGQPDRLKDFKTLNLPMHEDMVLLTSLAPTGGGGSWELL